MALRAEAEIIRDRKAGEFRIAQHIARRLDPLARDIFHDRHAALVPEQLRQIGNAQSGGIGQLLQRQLRMQIVIDIIHADRDRPRIPVPLAIYTFLRKGGFIRQ